MQTEQTKRAEIVFRRDHVWNAAAAVDRFLRELPDRRAFFAKAALAGKLTAPVLEIGAEYGVNAMLLQNEFGLPTVSLDLSRRALQASPIVARLLGMEPAEPLLTGDAERLPFAANSFGTVILWGTLSHFEDPTVLLSEIHRVLDAEGTLVVAGDPIRRRRRWTLTETDGVDNLRGVDRVLKWTGLLPYVARIGGKTEREHGVIGREFSPDEYERLLVGFSERRFFYEPVNERNVGSAGPQARARWAGRELVDRFGGTVSGWMTQTPALREVGENRYVLRKHPRHDRIAVRGFSGAFMCDGRTLTATDEAAPLPAEAAGRTQIVLDIPRFFTRIDVWDSRWAVGLASNFLPPEPPDEAPLDGLACPECVAFTDRCIFGYCHTECVAACPRDALEPTNPRMPVKTSCDGCGICLRACLHGGLDRPRIVEDRCPECRSPIKADETVIEARPRGLRERLNLANLERVVRF